MSVGSTVTEVIDDLDFVKGESIPIGGSKGNPNKRVVVVEFWATWCPPCRTSIPHVTEVAHRFKDKNVHIIGVTTEKNKRQIQEFVKSMGPKMDYAVAIDTHLSAQEALMVPSGARGIPHAFIIDWDDKVVWQGHPMEPAFESTLARLAASASPRQATAAPPPVTETVEELLRRPVRDLKALLEERGVYYGDCVEKPDLAKRIVERCSKV